MTFEWDSNKNKLNIRNHGITFEIATKVFLDEKRIEMFDSVHSFDEDRYKVIGLVGKILVVIYTEKQDSIRIISARKAEEVEINEYYKNYDAR